MIGGIERYFQIAKCYRDEKLIFDRQPEFTQLDLELSYVTREEIMSLIEDILCFSLSEIETSGLANQAEFTKFFQRPFQVMSFDEAMSRYGIDKPDLRFSFEIQEETSNSGETSSLKFLDVSELDISKKKLKNLIKNAEHEHSRNSKTRLIDNKIYSEDVELLGRIRKDIRPFLTLEQFDPLSFKPVWIIDFPLFEEKDLEEIYRSDLSGKSHMQTVHHPFTSPLETAEARNSDGSNNNFDDLELNLSTKSAAYDLVINGNEIGGGSIRIHNPELQEKIFKILDINQNGELDHILKALKAGAPPHGGIALGLDRLLAVLLRKSSIEEVIAFPKSAGGKCFMSNAPVEISDQVKETYHLIAKDEEEELKPEREAS